jgi:Cu/Ag efflux pump CusA
MASALFISFIIAWLAVPLLAAHTLTEKDCAQEENGALTRWFHQHYQQLLQQILPKPWLILLGLIPLLAAGFFSWQQTGSGFMPSMDEGGFILDYRAMVMDKALKKLPLTPDKKAKGTKIIIVDAEDPTNGLVNSFAAK